MGIPDTIYFGELGGQLLTGRYPGTTGFTIRVAAPLPVPTTIRHPHGTRPAGGR